VFLFSTEKIKSNIYLSQPYQPGRIPILFVHGTFSSPAYWAELANAVRGDPELLQKFQVWHFIYNSGHPVPFSAADLRDSLTNIIHTLDPTGCDPALRQIVIIGHSQGGLLAKLMTTDTGDKLWRVNHEHPLEESNLTDTQQAIARRFFFYKPLSQVRRLIFVATPHRGSYFAGSFFRGLANVSLAIPKAVARSGGKKDAGQELLSDSPTSVTSLSPGNPWLLALAGIPPAPGVKAHSIIAVRGSGDPKSGGDGIVKYSSAHVDYVESELVVRSGHRCQGNPDLVAEVCRILHEHVREMDSLATSHSADSRGL